MDVAECRMGFALHVLLVLECLFYYLRIHPRVCSEAWVLTILATYTHLYILFGLFLCKYAPGRRTCCSMKYHFLWWGYPPDVLDEASTRPKEFSLKEARKIKDKDRDKDGSLFMVTTYHLGNRTLQGIIIRNWEILKQSRITKHLRDTNVVFSLHRLKNIKDHLI